MTNNSPKNSSSAEKQRSPGRPENADAAGVEAPVQESAETVTPTGAQPTSGDGGAAGSRAVLQQGGDGVSADAADVDAPVQETAETVTPTGAQPASGDGGTGGSNVMVQPELQQGGGDAVEGSASGGKRKDRIEDAGEPSGGAQRSRRRGELLDPPAREPNCVICGKRFNSWKALFGHMRSHPGRQWRGVFPPPVGKWDPLVPSEGAAAAGEGSSAPVPALEEIAPTLLSVAETVLSRLSTEAGAGTSERTQGDQAGPSVPRRGLDIDLNEPNDEAPRPRRFDLNILPPEEEEEDKDKDSSS